MADYSDEFGQIVQTELRERDLSPYGVEDQSKGRLSHMTVRRMMKGNPPSSDHIVEFAEALETDPLLRKALADRLLTVARRRVRYAEGNASVRRPLVAGLSPAAVRV